MPKGKVLLPSISRKYVIKYFAIRLCSRSSNIESRATTTTTKIKVSFFSVKFKNIWKDDGTILGR